MNTLPIITAITPTGDRPLAFALCRHWMERQTRPPDQWLVVDDGAVAMEPSGLPGYIRRAPEGGVSMMLNLKAALPHIQGDRVLVIEDDEYYAPGYVERMAAELAHHEVAGICRSKYYHLPSGGYKQILNTTHASLAETGFRRSFLAECAQLLEGDTYLDMRLWMQVGLRRGFLFVDTDPLYVGMKALPGRAGIGTGHNARTYRTVDSPDRAVLKRWVPRDYQVYLDILAGKLTAQNSKVYFNGK